MLLPSSRLFTSHVLRGAIDEYMKWRPEFVRKEVERRDYAMAAEMWMREATLGEATREEELNHLRRQNRVIRTAYAHDMAMLRRENEEAVALRDEELVNFRRASETIALRDEELARLMDGWLWQLEEMASEEMARLRCENEAVAALEAVVALRDEELASLRREGEAHVEDMVRLRCESEAVAGLKSVSEAVAGLKPVVALRDEELASLRREGDAHVEERSKLRCESEAVADLKAFLAVRDEELATLRREGDAHIEELARLRCESEAVAGLKVVAALRDEELASLRREGDAHFEEMARQRCVNKTVADLLSIDALWDEELARLRCVAAGLAIGYCFYAGALQGHGLLGVLTPWSLTYTIVSLVLASLIAEPSSVALFVYGMGMAIVMALGFAIDYRLLSIGFLVGFAGSVVPASLPPRAA